MKNLKDLIKSLGEQVSSSTLPMLPVTGIIQDSRRIEPGNIFVAVSGGQSDGHRFIPEAIRRGAVAVVGTQFVSTGETPYIRVKDSRQVLAQLSAAFFDFPARNLTVIGVTGTDGKTTTSSLIYQILATAGIRAGMISTVNAIIGDEVVDTGFHVTTPEAPDIQRYLYEMVKAGLTHVILEVTSHGLDQHRVTGCDFDIGVVTNITHEHLDYHGSFEAYRAAKGRLFTNISQTPPKSFNPPRYSVLNMDDNSYTHLSMIAKTQQICYGLHQPAQVYADKVIFLPTGMQFRARGYDRRGVAFDLPFYTPLVGEYNVSNCLAAIAVTLGVLCLEGESVQNGIASLSRIPGRMEQISLPELKVGQMPFTAIVDFAHTPNALMRSLKAARNMAAGRVIAVFGSAGLRDRAKRRMMAEIAAELADLTILTAEDPRTEALDAILEEMALGMMQRGAEEGTDFWRIADRGEAIRSAIRMAGPGDLIIACGKGHEQSMCFGDTEYPWDDRQAMRSAIAEHYGLPGLKMPYLPTQNR